MQNASIWCYVLQNTVSDASKIESQKLCAPSVESSIEVEEYSMVNDDLKCCDNGHRDNILNKYHTSVSIGIAYSDAAVMIQNFENHHITLNKAVTTDGKSITISGVHSPRLWLQNKKGSSQLRCLS